MAPRCALVFGLVLGLGSIVSCTPAPDVIVVATIDLGTVAEADGIEARTHGASLYAFGRSVWLFGATQLTNPDSDGATTRASSWSHTADLGASDGIDQFITPIDEQGGPAELLPYTAEELGLNDASPIDAPRVLLRPTAAARDDHNDRVLLFYAKLDALTPIGSSIAVWTELEGGPVRPVLDASSEEPTLLFTGSDPPFGQAALVVGETLFAYACTGELYHPCQLARVQLDAVFERSAWEFWTGHGWVEQIRDAVAIFEAAPVLSVDYNARLQRYLAVYAVPGDDQLVLRTALTPEGPWSGQTRVLSASGCEDGLLHPEYRRQAGQFEYLSYRVGNERRLVEVELAPGE